MKTKSRDVVKLGRSLLIVAYKFPPMQSISCNRTWALYKGMQRYFDTVCVVSTSNRHVLPQDPVDTSTERVMDARTLDYRTVFQRNGRTAVSGEKMKTSLAGKTLARLQSSFPTLQVFGEGNVIYINNAYRLAVKAIRKYQVTHIFSTFPPYADHLIAERLKRRFPELFWIADFRDLHVDPAQDNLLWRRRQLRLNKRILSGADLVTTVSEGLAHHLRQLHPTVQVLKNGIRNQDTQHHDLYPRFTISYTGSMFQDKRRPDTLLKALRELIDEGVLEAGQIDLRYAGKDSAVWWPLIRKQGLENIFTDHGLISSAEAREIQMRSHLNVLLTYSTPELKGNLTGKLYDYLSSGRPMLVIVNGPGDDEIETVVAQSGRGQVVYHGEVAPTRSILHKAYQAWISGKSSEIMPDEGGALKAFSWDHQLREFAGRNGWTQEQSTLQE